MTLTAPPTPLGAPEASRWAGDGWAGDGWALTARISPRRVVRAAAVDADGRPLNSYPLVHPVAGMRPRTPWAVHLADTGGRFHLLCADLDAKISAQDAAEDAARLSGLLEEIGLPHLVCVSGPTGGRHVWLALREGVDAVLVSALAHLLKAWLPTLDVCPLLNPASGCVRPPGAPHRLGGDSRVIAGSVSVLTHPTVTAVQVHTLLARLAERVPAPTAARRAWRRRVAVADGMPFLTGWRRPLSPACRRLVDAVPSGDLSAVLWRILCGAAAARWRYDDVAAIADAPGLEHARSLRTGATRSVRPTTGAASGAAVLRRQWTRAVHAVAALDADPHPDGSDPSFDTRCEVAVEVARVVQGRADATPGRWGGSRAGLAQRRVLDALCLYHLQAVRPDEVEADIRRLALTCGLDRETARRALLALAADGWITRTQPASGRRGAHWSIDPAGVIHTRISRMLSQAVPRPAGTGYALRATLTDQLADRLDASAHDAFAATGGLRLEAGSLYGCLREPLDTVACSQLLGWPIEKTTLIVEQLAAAGLIGRGRRCWHRTGPERLERVAAEQGTTGARRRRAERHALERALWAWWLAELTWMRAARLPHACRRSPSLQGSSPQQAASWPIHPRHPNGRADFAAARRALRGHGWTQSRGDLPESAIRPVGHWYRSTHLALKHSESRPVRLTWRPRPNETPPSQAITLSAVPPGRTFLRIV